MNRVLVMSGLIASALGIVALGSLSPDPAHAPVDQPVRQRAQPLTAAAAHEALARGAVLVDVREPHELAAGKLTGAMNVPLTELKAGNFATALEAARGRPVILYCRSGRRSAEAGEILLRHGFREVYNLGGFEDAVKAGLPAA